MAAFSNTSGQLFGLTAPSGATHGDRHTNQCADQTRGWQSTPIPLSANRGGGHTPGIITHPACGHTTDSGTPRACDPSLNTTWAGISRSCGQQGLAGNTIDALRYLEKIGESMAGQSPSWAKNAAGRSCNPTPSIAQDQSSPPHPWLMANPGLIRSESASRNIRHDWQAHSLAGAPSNPEVSPVYTPNHAWRVITANATPIMSASITPDKGRLSQSFSWTEWFPGETPSQQKPGFPGKPVLQGNKGCLKRSAILRAPVQCVPHGLIACRHRVDQPGQISAQK